MSVAQATLHEGQELSIAARGVGVTPPAPAEPRDRTHIALQITAALQTSLDLNRQVEIFGAEIRKHVAHDSLGYSNEDLGYFIEEGTPGRHSCTYRLTLEDQALGEVRFTRGARFQEPEVELLEFLLCSLVYPLRNALHYRQALDEARRDALTGVQNRGAMDAALRREVALAHRHKTGFSVIVLDIDRFKVINDSHGHAVGDQVLRRFVACVNTKIRTTDILARFGGDEFVVLLANTPYEGARLLASRIREAVAAIDCSDLSPGLAITSSLGVAELARGESAEQLMGRADQALYQAKQDGRNCVRG
jgi:diguanylate cyclase (GGDEF)-like protein